MRRQLMALVGVVAVFALGAQVCQAQFGFGGGGGHGGGMGLSLGSGGHGGSGLGFSFGGGGHGGSGFNLNLGNGGFGGGHDWGEGHRHSQTPNWGVTINPGLSVPSTTLRPAPVASAPRTVAAAPAAPAAPPATVKSNSPPPEKIVVLRKNAMFKLGDVMPQPCYGLLGEVARMRAQEIIKEYDVIFVGLANPGVTNAWTVIKGRLQQNQQITANDLQQLMAAVNAIAELPATLNKDDLNLRMTTLAGFSKVIVVLSTPFPPGGWTPGIPNGVVNVIYCPCLPQGKHYWLPSGDVACGTGGSGQLALASGEATKMLDLPVGVGKPAPDSDAEVAKRVTSGILLMNPEENAAAIQYVLSNKNYSLKPSFRQALPDGQQWVVKFDRGGRFGAANYTLAKGTYLFGSSKKGWDLYNTKFEVTIDNSANTDPFYYAIDNTAGEVPPGGQATHKSDYPLLVRFDRGDGMQEAVKKVDKKNVPLVVALNRADGLWDLFPAENFPGQKLVRQTPQPERPLVLTGVSGPSTAQPQPAPQTCN